MRDHLGVGETLSEASTIYLSPIVLGELRAGFLRGSKRQRYEKQLEAFCKPLGSTLLLSTAKRYAVILESLRKAGTPIGTNDLWIASSATQHGLTAVTTDTRFSKGVGDPYSLLRPLTWRSGIYRCRTSTIKCPTEEPTSGGKVGKS